ncbi:MAG: AraC family transcriptional regulator, partial [Clostridia bacterium]|nr:AraC family transcriptional regulator [Clostridia bacterium]
RLVLLFDELASGIIMNENYIALYGIMMKIFGRIEEILTCKYNLHNGSKKDRALAKATDYIAANYEKKIGVDDIANVTGYSVSRFQHLFKNRYGITAIEYLINERIKKAKELLSFSSLNVQEICYFTGFRDPYYFSKMFKEKTGVSPREYRKKID